MLDISDANKAAVDEDTPWPVDFVEILVHTDNAGGTIRFTNHFHDITCRGILDPDNDVTFTAVSQLLGFGNIADNLEVTDNSLDISLSGVGQELTGIVLGNPVEGSRVYISRGFYNESTGDLADDPYHRWAGRVNSFNIQDDYRFTEEDKIIISIQCKSLLVTLLERVSGRYTNVPSFEVTNPGDQSMEFISSIVNFAPFFGQGAETPQPPPPPSGGGKHLCLQYYEFGDITLGQLESDLAWQKAYSSQNIYKGYTLWAKPIADNLEKGSLMYYFLRPFVTAWAQNMHYRVTGEGKRILWGMGLEWTIRQLCRVVGFFIKDDYFNKYIDIPSPKDYPPPKDLPKRK